MNLFVKVTNFEGESVVHLAAKNGQVDVCLFLAEKYGLDLQAEDGRGRTPKEILVDNGFDEEGKRLVHWMARRQLAS